MAAIGVSGIFYNFAKIFRYSTIMIKNLLFDLGGVIMDIKRERCVDALTRIGVTNANEMLGLYVQSGDFLNLENGSITADEFRNSIRANIKNGNNVSDNEIDNALNAFLVGIPLHRLAALRKLRQHYKIYLLSNTNPIMYYSEITRQFTQEGMTIDDYFDGQVVSFLAHSNKPEHKIFEYAIAHLGIDPAETLFIDDSQSNLDAAAQMGFDTALVPPGTEFEEILTHRLPANEK